MVVADKSAGKFRELYTAGVSCSPDEIARLEKMARQWIDDNTDQLSMDFGESERVVVEVERTFSCVERTLQNVPQVILNSVYDSIDFNAIEDDILRHLVSEDGTPSRIQSSTVASTKVAR